MKKFGIAIVFAICFLPSVSAANDLRFIPRAWLGVSDYSFKQGSRPNALPDGSDFPEVKFDVTFVMTGIGVTTVYDRYYLDLSYQDSLDESDNFQKHNYSEKLTGDRNDFSATIGMKILENRGNIYLGYKKGKSDATGNAGTRLSFKEDGFFIGGGYGWIIANTGLFSFNLAYADLDGNLKENPGPGYPSGLNMDADSEASGLSYGISWSANLSNNFGYSVSVDANDYDFEDLKDKSTTVPLPDKIEETFYTMKLSISYRF